MSEGPLERELRRRLDPSRYVLRIKLAFLDLFWDADASLEMIMAADPGVSVDGIQGERRIVFQRVRDELRYWLTTEREPLREAAQTELGTVASVDDAIALCEEFLNTDISISEATRPRIVLRRTE